MKFIRPKNWNEFQHYKERAPVWIKLHKRLLDDFEFQTLPVASRALAPMLWLLASEHDNGDIPAFPRRIAFRLRMTLEELSLAFEPIVRRGFFEIIDDDGTVASIALAECEHDAIPEKEIQVTSKTQVQTEGEARVARTPNRKSQIPQDFPSQALLQTAVEFWTEHGRTDLCATVADEAQKFRDWCSARGELALDWPAKWRTWTRSAMRFNPRKDANGHGQQRTRHDAAVEGGALAIAILTGRNGAGDHHRADEAFDELPANVIPATSRKQMR